MATNDWMTAIKSPKVKKEKSEYEQNMAALQNHSTDTSNWQVIGGDAFGAKGENSASLMASLLYDAGKRDRDATYDLVSGMNPSDSGVAAAFQAYTRHVDYEREQEEAARLAEEQAKAARYGGGRTTTAQPAANPTAADEIRNKYSELIRRAQNDLYTAQGMNGENDMGAAEEAQRRITQYQNEMNAELEKLTLNNKEMVDAFNESIPERSREAARQRPKVEPNPPRQSSSNIAQLEWELSYAQGTGTQEDIEAAQRNLAQAYAKQAVGSDDAPDAAASELISAEDRARVAEYQRYEAVSTEELNAQIAQYQQDAADAEEAQSKYALEATTRNGKGANDKEYRDFLERKFNEAVAAEEEANAKIAEAQKLLREKQAYESNLTQEQMNQLRTQANLQSEFDEARAAVERAQEVYNQAVSDLETGAARNSRAANAEMQYYADMYEIRANQLNALVNQYERRQANGADEETLQILYNNIRQAQEDVNVLGTGYSAKTEAANAASAEAEKAAESVIGAQNALDIANGHLANTIGRYYEATAGQYSGTSDKYREAYEQVQGLDVLISGYERKLEYARNNEDPNVPYYMSDRAKYAARIDELKAERAKYEAFAWQYEASRTLESMTGTEIRDFNILAQEYAKLRENVKSQAISVALDESGMSNSVQNVSSTGVKLSENGERLRKYYVNKYGEEQFNRMLELAQREANRRRVESMAETVRNGKWYEDVGYSAFSVVSNVLSAPGVITEIVLQATDNSKAPIDTNAPGFAMQNATRTIRSEVGQKIEQSVLNAGGNETAAHWAGIGYSTLMSGIDSLVAMALGGALGASSGLEGEALQELSSKVGGAFLGVTATTNAAQESLERGESLETSVLKGIVAGVFEGLFEKYSIEKLGKLGEMEMKEGFKDVLRNMGKSALTNFSEEFNTELANLAYDGIQWLFTGDSELKDRYEEIKASYGLTDSQAAKSAAVELALALNLDENWAFAFDILGQALEAGASGALMGAWFGAQYSIKPYAAYRNLNRVIDTIEDSPNARAYYEIQQRNFALDDDHRVDLPDYRQNVTTQEELRTMARQVQDAQIKQNADLKQWQAEHPEEAAAARQKAQELGAVNVHTVADMDEVNAQAEAGAAAGTADAQAQDAREGVRIDEESVSRETAGNTEQTTNTQPAGTQGEPVFNEFAEERARDELAALDRYADRPTYDERVQRRIAELRAEGSDDVADAMQQAVNARQSGAAEQTQTAEAAATAETSSMRTTVPAQTGYTVLSGLDAQDRANVTADVQQVVRGATDRDGTINVEFANDIADNMENTYRASGREDLIVPFRNAVNEAINGGNENAVLYDNESGRGTGTSAAEQSGRVAGRAGEAESAAERSAESAGGQTGTAQSRAGETGESGQISDSAVSDMTEIAGEDGYSGHKVTNVTNAPEYDALNESADAFGVNLTIVKGQLWFNTESGRPFKTNGAFDPANNKIYVQADDPGVSANVIFLHELFHMMAVQNADMYDDVVAKVTELYGGDLENVLRDYRESYSDLGNVSDSYLMQELCADIYAGYDRKNHGQSRYTEQIQAIADKYQLNGTSENTGKGIRGSAVDASTEADREYMDAVESGDTEEAQRMVDEAAQSAGYDTPKLYHGTQAFGFTEFDLDLGEQLIFATSDPNIAQTYSGETDLNNIAKKTKINVDAFKGEDLLQEVKKYLDYYADFKLMTEEEKRSAANDTRESIGRTLENAAAFVNNHERLFAGVEKMESADELLNAISFMSTAQTKDELQAAWDRWETAIRDLKQMDESLTRRFMSAIYSEELTENKNQLYDLMYDGDLYADEGMFGSVYLPDVQLALDLNTALRRGVYELYGKRGKQLVIDANGSNWNSILPPDELNLYGPQTTRDIAQAAKANGYDSVLIKDLKDGGGATTYNAPGDIYIFFNANQVKSADPVTYDDDGNVIPLSERFDTTTPERKNDIRFSATEPHDDLTNTVESGYQTDENAEVPTMEQKAASAAAGETLRERERKIYEQALAKRDRTLADNLHKQWAAEDKAKELYREANMERAAFRADGNADHLNRANALTKQGKAEWQKASRLSKQTNQPVGDLYEPKRAIRTAADGIMRAFNVKSGLRAQARYRITEILRDIYRSGKVDDADLYNVVTRLANDSISYVMPDAAYEEAYNGYLKGARIYVDPATRAEFGDAEGWRDFQKHCWAMRIYLTSNANDRAVDSYYDELSSAVSRSIFDEDVTDKAAQLQVMADAAEFGMPREVSLVEAMREEGVESDELYEQLFNDMLDLLTTFAEQANLETRLSITPDTDMMRTRAHYEARLERAEERNRAARDAQEQKTRERIADIRESERQKRDDLRQRLTQEGRDMRDEAVARERQKRDEMLEKFKKHVQDVNQGAKERRQRSETINRIRKELDRIYKRAKVNEADYTRVISQQDELTREDMEDAYSELNGIATSMVGYEITNPAQLAAWLKDYKRANTDFDASDLLDGAVNSLVEIKDWQKMSVENLNLLLDVLQRIDYALNTAHKMIGGAWNERANEVGEQMRKETRSAKGSRIAGSNASSARARAAYLFNEDSLSYSRNLKRYGDWNPNSVMYKFAEAFERGDMDYMNYKLGADMVLMPFLARRSNAANREWLYTAAGKDAKLAELTLPASQVVGDGDAPASDTVKVKLNQMQLVQMMLDLRNEDNVYHVEHGGYTFPDAEMYNKKGRKADAYKEGGHITVRMTRAQMQNAVDTYLAKEGKAFAELLDKYYNVYAKPHINATSRALEGVDKALNQHYYPIRTDSNYRGKTYQPYTSVIENMGPLKERIVGADNPIYLCDADETYQWHKELMGKYVGYAIPMRDFQTVMKYQPHHDTVSNRGVLEEKFSGNAGRFIDSFEKFINSSQFEDASTLSNLLGNYVSNILNANISSMLKQFAALPLAGSTYGMEPINYAIAHLGRKVDLDLIRKYTAYLDERSDGITYDQVTDIVREKAGSAGRIALATALGRNWLSATDYWANKLMWIAAEHYVDTHTSLRPGSEADIQAGKDPYYQKVAEVFDRMTFDTQTNSNTMAKPNILRHVSGDVKALTLFKTDAFQMQGILREAFGQHRWAQENGTDSEKYEAKQKTYHAVQGVVLSSVTQAALAAIAMVLRRKDDKLKDDEGNYDWKKIGKSLGADAFENVAGAVLFGEEIVSAIWSMFDKDQQWYGVEAPALEAISDFANTLYNQLPKLFSTIFTAADGAGAQWLSNNSDKITNPIMRIARDTARIFGFPLANIEKNLLGALGWIWPDAAVGIADLYTAYAKNSLTGKRGRELESSIRAYLTDEVGRFSDEAMKEYARLYGEFGNDALPGFGEPTVYDEEGEKRDLTPEEVGRWDSAYRTTMLDLANEIVESDVYKALTDDEKLSLLESAEAYAKEAAKAAIGLDAGKLVQTVDAAVGDNIDTATALMCYGAMKSQGKYADKFLALDALPIPDEQKAAYFHINYPSTAKAWAEAAETMTDLEFLAFAREKYGTADAESEAPGIVAETPAAPMPRAETENAQEAAETPQEPPIDPAKEAAYQNAVKAGMSESGARAAVDAASAVKSDNSRDRQAAAAAAVEDAEDQLAAVRLYADYPEADYARYSAANGYGVSPSAFLTWYNDATAKDPNHSLSQNEAQAALDAMDDLTQEQKAAMWQLCNAQWSAKKNPYAVYIGEQVREAYYANRETKRSMPMPEIADGPYTGGNRPTARQADNVTGRGSVYRRGHEHESGQSLEDPYNGYHYDGSVVYDDNGNTYDFSSVHTELQSLDGTTNLTERQNTEYENLKASGMDYDSALSVVRRLYDDFFPEGPDDLRYKQMNAVMAIEDEHRFWSAWEMDTLEDKKYKEANELAAIRYYSDQPDADYARFSAALNVGTRPSDYMEMFRDFEELYGTAKPSQTQVEGYIENYIGPLMGDRQKAALWQLANPNWSAKDNPYSVMVGEQIQDAYYANLNLGR